MASNKELEILHVLEDNPCVAQEQLATMVGLPVEEVGRIVGDLCARGVIIRYRGVINWEKAGELLVSALIEVRVAPQREVGFDAIAQRIARFPEVRSLYLVSGTFDLAVNVVGRTMQDVASFVSSKIAPLDGVQGTVTHFLLKTYKEDGVLVEGDQQPSRLPISP
ncbi:MAG: Lrp/AsnC family transcriptional regulator [Dehalococcoidales bacterium]|nr:Lrp/AsnC family transcriptional regulator [Dehalococcoidales bacterium]